MILPIMLYCSNIRVGMPDSKRRKVENIRQKSLSIINRKRKNCIQLPSANHNRKKRCTIEVFECLIGKAPTAFADYKRDAFVFQAGLL